ncbi:MAG: SBBP repeat-containing protein [Bacteroidia bacterium]|nr:SBBP repeat-containing protein [Bacteroidia bacterium]
MKKHLYIIIFFFFLNIIKAQTINFQWSDQIGGTFNDSGNSIALDGSGNVYSIGRFTGTVDFDPGVGISNLTAPSGFSDIFILKLNSSGNFIWAKQLGGNNDDYGYALTIDGAGNVLATGCFQGVADFDPSVGTFTLSAKGQYDSFILKLDAAGNFIWAKQLGGSKDDIGYSIIVDNSNNIYSTGNFIDTADFDPGVSVYNLIAKGGLDIFVSKLDSSGNFIWAKKFGGNSDDYSYSIVTDASGNVFTTGEFTDTTDFDPSFSVFNLISASPYFNSFISKLDPSGNFAWAKMIGGTRENAGSSIKLNATGDVFVAGPFSGTADFDPSLSTYTLNTNLFFDIFVLKLDGSGNFVWAKQMGGTSNDYATSLSLDNSGNVYTTGIFRNSADFDPNVGTYNLTSVGFEDIFVSKLDPAGNFIWAKSFGSTQQDNGASVAVDGLGNVYTTGFFESICNFDFGNSNFSLSSFGGWDAFVCKLSQGTLGLVENTQEKAISIYPNPTNDKVYFFNKEELIQSFKLLNSIGQCLIEKTNIQFHNVTLDLSDYQNGIYFLEVNSADCITRTKLVKN